jgi:hypothetical protein
MEVRIKGIKLETMAARQLPFQIVKLIWLTKSFFARRASSPGFVSGFRIFQSEGGVQRLSRPRLDQVMQA